VRARARVCVCVCGDFVSCVCVRHVCSPCVLFHPHRSRCRLNPQGEIMLTLPDGVVEPLGVSRPITAVRTKQSVRGFELSRKDLQGGRQCVCSMCSGCLCVLISVCSCAYISPFSLHCTDTSVHEFGLMALPHPSTNGISPDSLLEQASFLKRNIPKNPLLYSYLINNIARVGQKDA
jgi:hypothetical protein